MLCVFVERFEAVVVIVAMRVDHRYRCWVKMSTTVDALQVPTRKGLMMCF